MYPLTKLGQLLTHRKKFITIDDFEDYMLCRVQWYGKGIILRKTVKGVEIKTKQQQVCRTGEFLVAEIDAKEGGFGVVPAELDGAIVSSHYFLFQVNARLLDSKYLRYFIQTPYFLDQVSARGTTNYASIRPNHVLEYKIPLPPLEEQRRIVAHIDAIAEQIAAARGLRQSAVEEAEALLGAEQKSVYENLYEKFGSLPLSEIANQITDGTHYTPTYIDDGVPFLSVKDISSGVIDFANVRYIAPYEHEQLTRRCKPEFGDILLTKVGTTGIAKAIDTHREFSIFVSLALIKIDQSVVVPKFTEHMLNSPPIRAISEEKTRGVGNKNLVLKFIKEFPIPVASINVQHRVVTYLDMLQAEVERLKQLHAETAAKLDALLPSLLDRAFKGEL